MHPYGHDIIVCGKCSLCGGRVVLPRVWMSVVPAKPICERCGAVEDDTVKLPVIPMKPRDYYDDWTCKIDQRIFICSNEDGTVKIIWGY